MKKFSNLNYKIKDTKYKETIKNDIYTLVKENINIDLKPVNEVKNINFDEIKIDLNGTDDLVNEINRYINNKLNEERISVLNFIKSSISTGVLNLKMINEAINSCECSELCPNVNFGNNILNGDDFDDNDFDESENNKTEYVSTNEYLDLTDKFIDLLESDKINNMTWEDFFIKNNISENYRNSETISKVYNLISLKRPDLLK